ncbi:VWA domain-containing protein [Corynebacterium sp. H130]|uniref:VWA domain-containing protein n=1 Tax=Corynebacterium sp. H130 TaxID=3133444 RepID=UPI0030B2A15D
MTDQRMARWRLILGEGAEVLGELDGADEQRVEALDFLYSRETVGMSGGVGPSTLNVPTWINAIRDLFPKEVCERIESDAFERYGLAELVTDAEVLRSIEPSAALLRAILQTKHLMQDEVLDLAREIVHVVVKEMMEKIRSEIRESLSGRKDPHRRSRRQIAVNFDAKATIRANLKNYSPERNQLVISDPLFSSRSRRHWEKWRIIVAVDQSGSMVDSVIHAAVSAAIFAELPSLDTRLIAFDTEVVDLSQDVIDPVEALMKVQLGGGTAIYRALEYAEQLVDTPSRTMVVLISDLYEGSRFGRMESAVRRLVNSGVKVLILGALDQQGAGSYDVFSGKTLARLGAHVGVMTPLQLADWVAEVMA